MRDLATQICTMSRSELAVLCSRLAAMSDELRALIEKAGGLHTAADLATRWGISRQRVEELTRSEDFPRPVLTIGRSNLYAGYECDVWKEKERTPGPSTDHRQYVTTAARRIARTVNSLPAGLRVGTLAFTHDGYVVRWAPTSESIPRDLLAWTLAADEVSQRDVQDWLNNEEA